MRGAPAGDCSPTAAPGIIPADAGSTEAQDNSGAEQTDHPRGCGEHMGPEYDQIIDLGSSPRMRGALSEEPGKPHRIGIIPADAGST